MFLFELSSLINRYIVKPKINATEEKITRAVIRPCVYTDSLCQCMYHVDFSQRQQKSGQGELTYHVFGFFNLRISAAGCQLNEMRLSVNRVAGWREPSISKRRISCWIVCSLTSLFEYVAWTNNCTSLAFGKSCQCSERNNQFVKESIRKNALSLISTRLDCGGPLFSGWNPKDRTSSPLSISDQYKWSTWINGSPWFDRSQF